MRSAHEQPRWIVRGSVVVSLVLSLLTVATSISSSSTDARNDYLQLSDEENRPPYQQYQEALVLESALLASEDGTSEPEAKDALIQQNTFGVWLADIVDTYPSFSTAEFTREDKKGHVWFSGEVPEYLLRSHPIDMEVALHGGAAWSEEQAVLLSQSLQQSLMHEGLDDFAIDPDELAGTLHVLLPESLRVNSEELRALVPDHLQGLVAFSSEAGGLGSVDSRGGGRISQSETDASVHCTTGFSASRYGAAGQATAGHCDVGVALFYRPTSTTALGIVWGTSHEGSWGDFWWGNVDDDTAVPEFYATHTNVRTVAATAYAAVGDWLCNYGRARDLDSLDCATVTHINQTRGAAQRQVVVDEDNAFAGDSGGPWYSLTTAYGIHRGSSCSGACATDAGTSWFSQVRYLDDATNAFVMID